MSPNPRIPERLEPRVSDLGGLTVHRVLPKARRRTIGAWCFVDLFDGAVTSQAAAGALATADGAALSPSMDVGPHPHTGLHTVTWLTAGALHHTDSVGSDQVVRPGELNLMTAGWGVAHAEHHVDHTAAVAGAQLWLAQPDATRNGDPTFSHHGDLPVVRHGALHATVMVGTHDTERSPAAVDTPAVALALNATDDCRTSIALDAANEYCVVVLTGEVVVFGDRPRPSDDATSSHGGPSDSSVAAGTWFDGGVRVPATTGLDLGGGRTAVTIAANVGSTALVLGGPPLGEDLVMFWNFVGRTRAEVATAATQWNAHDPRFGSVESPLQRIAAPAPPWGK
jgi:redox-sensitive bicupin YhaK (pirin superfamily)